MGPLLCKSQKDVVKEIAANSNGTVKWLGKGDTRVNKGTEIGESFSESWPDSALLAPAAPTPLELPSLLLFAVAFCDPSQLPIPAHQSTYQSPLAGLCSWVSLGKMQLQLHFSKWGWINCVLKSFAGWRPGLQSQTTFIAGACKEEKKTFFSFSHADRERGEQKQREPWFGFCSALLSSEHWAMRLWVPPRTHSIMGRINSKGELKSSSVIFLIKTFGEKFSPLTFEKRNT